MKIALLGAESTGKTELAHALAAHLAARNLATLAVDEYLREWCEAQGRTPQVHEQAAIAAMQQQRIEAAALQATWVFADTTPLMTAIYSEFIFNDMQLHTQALTYQRSFDLTLLAGLDMPWQPDGIQRDGPHVREPVDALLRKTLQAAGINFHVVYGQGAKRLTNAVHAIESALKPNINDLDIATKRIARNADFMPTNSPKTSQKWQWQCDKCSDPECEHRLFRRLMPST
jgi:nicotinamide riboside kinase